MTVKTRKIGPRPATKDRLRSKKAFRVWHDVVLDNEATVSLGKVPGIPSH